MMTVSVDKPTVVTPADDWLQPKRASQHFDANECLLGTIQQALKESGPVVVMANRRRLFRIDASARRYSVLDPSISQRDWLTPTQQTDVLKGEHPAIESLSHANGNIDDLLWDAGYHGCQGRLPAGAHAYDVIQLRQWPNLTRVAHCRDTARICAMLTRSRATIAMVARWLKVPIEDVHRVYAAATAAGLVDLRFSGAKLDRVRESELPRGEPTDLEAPATNSSNDGAGSGLSGFLGRMVARLRKL